MTPNIQSLRKEFQQQQQQQQSHSSYQQQQQLLADSPMKPKKRMSDSSKKPKKRRSSSASDKENDAISQQHLPMENSHNTTTTTTTTQNGYTNSNNTPEAASLLTDTNATPPSNSTTAAPTPTSPSSTATANKQYDPSSMEFELDSAVELMTRFVSKSAAAKTNLHKLHSFNTLLSSALREYYTGHWYPECPMRGSGHRCLRVNQSGSTSIIEKTAETSGNTWVLESLPKEFTMWIDPGEVSYRIGEDGSICVHFSRPATAMRPVNTKQG